MRKKARRRKIEKTFRAKFSKNSEMNADFNTAILTFAAGLLIGQWLQARRFKNSSGNATTATDNAPTRALVKPTPDQILAAERAEEDSVEDSNLVPAGVELKMVICVRTDLSMSKGKIAAQCGHAVLGAYKIAKRITPEYVKAWEWRAQAKITLKVDSEAQMDEIAAAARAAGLPSIIIEDAGRTEVAPGTRTVLGIGPAPRSEIDVVTGKLKLFT
jgi:peptidyl-tRNA hydrolase, PTH2 family